MDIFIIDTEEVGQYTAAYIVGRIRSFEPTANRPFVLGLPTGSTPLSTYKHLISAYQSASMLIGQLIDLTERILKERPSVLSACCHLQYGREYHVMA